VGSAASQISDGKAHTPKKRIALRNGSSQLATVCVAGPSRSFHAHVVVIAGFSWPEFTANGLRWSLSWAGGKDVATAMDLVVVGTGVFSQR
jgi:hypothetical protein